MVYPHTVGDTRRDRDGRQAIEYNHHHLCPQRPATKLSGLSERSYITAFHDHAVLLASYIEVPFTQSLAGTRPVRTSIMQLA